jgi:hypothetical protein
MTRTMAESDALLCLQVTFNKSTVLAPSVINTTFFNQSGGFNTSALLEVRTHDGVWHAFLSSTLHSTAAACQAYV